MSDLTVTVDGHDLTATWTRDNPETRIALADALPVSGDGATLNCWRRVPDDALGALGIPDHDRAWFEQDRETVRARSDHIQTVSDFHDRVSG